MWVACCSDLVEIEVNGGRKMLAQPAWLASCFYLASIRACDIDGQYR